MVDNTEAMLDLRTSGLTIVRQRWILDGRSRYSMSSHLLYIYIEDSQRIQKVISHEVGSIIKDLNKFLIRHQSSVSSQWASLNSLNFPSIKRVKHRKQIE